MFPQTIIILRVIDFDLYPKGRVRIFSLAPVYTTVSSKMTQLRNDVTKFSLSDKVQECFDYCGRVSPWGRQQGPWTQILKYDSVGRFIMLRGVLMGHCWNLLVRLVKILKINHKMHWRDMAYTSWGKYGDSVSKLA